VPHVSEAAALKQPLFGVVGPTATGKTALAVELAKKIGNAELINCDSRQVIRGLHVGTCAPTPEELQGIPCHLLNLCDPGEPFSAADWLRHVQATLSDIERRGITGVLVGGTGLYVEALTQGYALSGVAPDPDRREQRTKQAETKAGLDNLAAELRRRDAQVAENIDIHNPRRIIRALEILDANGKDIKRASTPQPAILFGIDVPKEIHTQWIRQRTEKMFQSGALLNEIGAALHRGVSRNDLRKAGIGYGEALDVNDGKLRIDEAIALVSQRTLRYAKAQRTWFRHHGEVHWLPTNLVVAIQNP
jgi:tRNA dimethylallyltransferase